jgi:hypothetical protein
MARAAFPGTRARELQPAQYGRHRIPRVFQHDGDE